MYQDVVSLYPSIQMMKEFPIGAPIIHWYFLEERPCHPCTNKVDRFRDPVVSCNCSIGIKGYGGSETEHQLNLLDCRGTQPTAESFINDPTMFGYVCCDLIPPKNLVHPVIQIYKRIVDPVTRAIIGEKCECNLVPADHLKLVLDTPTLKHALGKGYILEKVYRFDKYRFSKPAWMNISMEFYVDKERTSGPAPSTETSGKYVEWYNRDVPDGPPVHNEREAYVALYNHRVPGLGDLLLESMNTSEWKRNKAQRAVYKLINNCGWGKHAEKLIRPNHSSLQTGIDDEEIKRIFQNVSANTMDLEGCYVFDEGKRIILRTKEKNVSPNLGKVYLAAGAMVPAYARLKLLEGLEICGDRVAMCDTDSIVYKTSLDPRENIPADDVIGGWSVEDISTEGITGFVGYGPKSYSIKTTKEINVQQGDGTIKKEFMTLTKLKGIQQTNELGGIDFETLKTVVEDYLNGGNL